MDPVTRDSVLGPGCPYGGFCIQKSYVRGQAHTMSRVRRWCFTIYRGADRWRHTDVAEAVRADIRFIVYQREDCPTTGRLHVQGYVEFKKALRLKGVQRALGCPTAAAFACEGTAQDNINYCTAEKAQDGSPKRAIPRDGMDPGPFQWGTPAESTQGQRTDLKEVKRVLDEAKTNQPLLEAADHDFGAFLKYGRMMEKYVELKDRSKSQQFRAVTTYWISGPSTTGKSRWCYESYGPDEIFTWSTRMPTQWFDGYRSQPVLLIDDLDRGEVSIAWMLRLLDHYPLTLPIKGGHVQAQWTVVMIVSNLEVEELYPIPPIPLSQYTALKMRIAWFGRKASLDDPMVLERNVPSRVFPV